MADHINVFLSSTSRDLTEYRTAVAKVISDMGMFPVGMENFQPTGDNPVQVCYEKIQATKIFVGIYAYRYGYIPDAGITYGGGFTDGNVGITHMEYEWAMEKGIPICLFLVDVPINEWNREKDRDPQLLEGFKAHILKHHTVGFFKTPDDLAAKVATGLHNVLRVYASQFQLAFSKTPRTYREMTTTALIGRDGDWKWLSETTGDRLLVGQSGSGKTALLNQLVQRDNVWFVVSTDRKEIAAALKTIRPEILIVDDSQAYIEAITDLRQLREELNIGFSIVASCWLGEDNRIQQRMNLSPSQIHRLPLLTRDEIVEIIKMAGIEGPIGLVREINNQAEGRPGLAVALAQLCIKEGVQELVTGEALARDLLDALQTLIGEKYSEILAAFAVGGDTGLELETVAKILEIRVIDLYRIISELAAGGVIFNHPYHQTISVRPRAFRHTLIRKTFFNNASVTMPNRTYLELAANAPSLPDVAMALVGTSVRGAAIPYDFLHNIIEEADSEKVWNEYAWSSKSAAKWILTVHPDRLYAVATAALHNAPEIAIPMLLEKAVGDNRALHSHPEHPLRQIKDWVEAGVPGTNEALARRTVLFRGIQTWVDAGKDINVALKTLEFALSPEFDTHYADPGSGLSITIHYGYLTLSEMEGVFNLWKQTVEMLENREIDDWASIRSLVETWAYKRQNVEMSDEAYIGKREFARRMLEGVIQLAQNKPSINLWASSLASDFKWNLDLSVDKDILTLYPKEKLENWRKESEKQARNVRSLAQLWSQRSPEQVIERILFIENEAKNLGRSHPRWTPYLCSQISQLVEDHVVWLHSFLSFDLPSEMIAPFLNKAAEKNEQGWVGIAEECLLKPNIREAVISLVLTTDCIPDKLFNNAAEYFEAFSGLIQTHGIRNEMPERVVEFLLRHPSDQVALSVAIGEWHSDPKREVRSTLFSLWREVIVKRVSAVSDRLDWVLIEIFKQDSTIAFDWLEARIRQGDFLNARHFAGHRDAASMATEVLDINARKILLRQVQPTNLSPDLIDHLVGDEVEVFKELLSILELTDLHLAPLVGEPNEIWIEKAIIALAAGYSSEDIAGAVHGIFRVFTCSGKESDMWQGWINSFSELLTHDDPRIRQVGQIGVEQSEARRQQSLKQERDEDVYGD